MPATRTATIARQLGMNLTAVAHHLSLLGLPPLLDDALEVWPMHFAPNAARTQQDLALRPRPDQVHALLASEADITRTSVCPRSVPRPTRPAPSRALRYVATRQADHPSQLAACDRLERALSRINPPDASTVAAPGLFALRGRVEAITTRWLRGSDRQTPSQAER